MFRSTNGRIVTLCVFLTFAVAVAFYIHEQSKPVPEPIKSNKTLVPQSKQVVPMKTPQGETTFDGVKPPDEDLHTGHTHLSHEHNYDMHEVEAESETPEGSDVTEDVASMPEEPSSFSDKEIEKWTTSTIKILEDLDRKFMEKYPEAFKIGSMTPEEFFKAYPTPESQQALQERMNRIQGEIFMEMFSVYTPTRSAICVKRMNSINAPDKGPVNFHSAVADFRSIFQGCGYLIFSVTSVADRSTYNIHKDRNCKEELK